MLKFRCSNCQQKLGVPDEYAGRRVKCNKCGQPSTVPHPVVLEDTPPKTEPEPEQDGMDIFAGLEGLDEGSRDDARQEAIRMASQDRSAKNTRAADSPQASKKKKKTKASSGRAPIADMLPDALHLPVALVASLIVTAAAIGIWIAAAKAAEDPLCFVALFVCLAAALTLRIFTVNHTLFLALLGMTIGVAGILAGKVAIAKHVVIPMEKKFVNEEFLVDLDKIMADEKLKLPPSMSAKSYAQDGDYMFCVALISMVDDDLADPVQVRKWSLARLKTSNKTNAFKFLTEGPKPIEIPVIEDADEEVFAEVSKRLFQWHFDKTSVRYAKKYYPALKKLERQCEKLRVFEKEEKLFKHALIQTVGFFDLVWILLGMGIGFGIVVFD